TIALECQCCPTFRFHLGRLEDRPSTRTRIYMLIPEQLSQFRGDEVTPRVRLQGLLVKCSRLCELTLGQRSLAAVIESSCELGEYSCRLRIPGRGPRPVGDGGIPVLERLMGASPLREEIG